MRVDRLVAGSHCFPRHRAGGERWNITIRFLAASHGSTDAGSVGTLNSGREHLQPLIMGASTLRGEIDAQYLASDKAKEHLGWQPRYTLDEGLAESIAWYGRFFAQETDRPK